MPPAMPDVQVPVAGTSLEGRLEVPEGPPRGALVLLHGFASTHAEFADAPERLAARGWVALAVTSRAHDARATVGGTIRAEAAVEDLAAAAEWLREEKRWSGALGLVAHSMGGALACLALPHLPSYRAAALVAPLDTIRAEVGAFEFLGYRAARLAHRAGTALGLRAMKVPYKYDVDDLFVDPACAARAGERLTLAREVSLANFDALMAISGEAWARKVRTPTLVVLNRHDKAVQHASSRRVYDALAGPKRLVEIDSGHSSFGDRCAADLAEVLDAWFAESLPRATAR